MKKILLLILLIALSSSASFSQIKGEIYSDTANLTVYRVWGTHYERGYAYGYLANQKIMSVWNDFVVKNYSAYLPAVRALIGDPAHFTIGQNYVNEAKGILDGLGAAGADTTGLIYLDLLMVNFFTDLSGFVPFKSFAFQNCSSLMDWGAATVGTGLNGKTVISHHLDTDPVDSALVSNQVMVVHIPSEPGEQPWLLTGVAGQIVASQGVNKSGLCAFLNSVNGFNAQLSKGYEPMTITLRRALETIDINGDGLTNVNDVRYAINSNVKGYANGFIVCAAAPSTAGNDSLVGIIAELAPDAPYITYRNNTDFDSVRGDNLYAANNMIKRNNAQQYCSRYNATRQAINNTYNGVAIGSQDNWNIMKTYSTQASNLQFMQVIPENGVFKISARTYITPAFNITPQVFSLYTLFSETGIGISENTNSRNLQISVFPNPAENMLNLSAVKSFEKIKFDIIDFTGRILLSSLFTNNTSVDISGFSSGVYLIKLYADEYTVVKKFVKR
jgi:hypothetical protein